MEIVVSQQRGNVPVTLFAPQGERGAALADRIEGCAKEVIAAGARDLVLVLQTPYLGRSEIIAIDRILLFMLARQSRKDYEAMPGGIRARTFKSPHLKLVCPSPHTLQPLHIAGANIDVEIYSDLKQAIASFGPSPQPKQTELGTMVSDRASHCCFREPGAEAPGLQN